MKIWASFDEYIQVNTIYTCAYALIEGMNKQKCGYLWGTVKRWLDVGMEKNGICISYQSLLYIFSYHLHATYILMSARVPWVIGLRIFFVYLYIIFNSRKKYKD